MFKGDIKFITEILAEKRKNLLKYRSIYSFVGTKLSKEAADQCIKDIDDFLSEVRNMKDFYVDVNNSADAPENFTGLDVKYIRLPDHISEKTSVYWVMIAVEAVQIPETDRDNHVLYIKDGTIFYVENKFYGTKKGHIRIKPAKFSDE